MDRNPSFSSNTASMPQDSRPLIFCGSPVLEIDALMRKLWDAFPRVFTIVKGYTTMPISADQSEVNDYHYVSDQAFSSMVANGDFATYTIRPDSSYGVKKQTIADAIAAGRIVVMEVELSEVQQLKAILGFEARFIYIRQPSVETAETRMQFGKLPTETIALDEGFRQIIAGLDCPRDHEREETELDYARSQGIFDLILSSEDLDEAFESIATLVGSTL